MVSVRTGPSIDESDANDPSREVFFTLPDGRRVKFTFAYQSDGVGGLSAIFNSEPSVAAKLDTGGDVS